MKSENNMGNDLLVISEKKQEKEFWKNVLSGDFLFSSFLRNSYKSSDSLQLKQFIFNETITEKIFKLSNNSDHLLFTILTNILNILLYRYSGKNDISITCPVLERKELKEALNSILIVRNRIDEDETFKSLLIKTKQLIIEATKNQNFPVIAFLKQNKNFTKELVSVSILLENIHDRKSLNSIKSNFIFSFFRESENLELNIEYDPQLYNERRIDKIVNHYINILEIGLANPDELTINEIDFLNEFEKNELVTVLNENKIKHSDNENWVKLFYDQLLKTPDNIAIIKNNNFWTYTQLNSDSNKLANYLIDEHKLSKNQPVGVLMDSEYDRMVALIGILKSGGAFVPLPTDLPENRLKFMIDDANIRIVISQKMHIRLLNRLQWQCNCLETFLCTDTYDIDAVEESDKSNLMNKELWEHVGENAIDDITGGGWLNSFTGKPFSRDEMDEYGDNVLKKIDPYLNENIKVLEIGCASGISMYRISPKVKSYYGTDLSESILDWNREYIVKNKIVNIKLECLPAHDIEKILENDFDIIIINSVIQAFHGHNYLRNVIKSCIKLTGNKGLIFLGDIMDLEQKDRMIQDLINFKKNNEDKDYRTKLSFSEELFLSRQFFNDLFIDFSEINNIQFSDKIFCIENELTKYRYDVILKIDKNNITQKNVKRNKNRHDLSVLNKHKNHDVIVNYDKNSVAYITYTSGTTGTPKGVIIGHESLANLCHWHNDYYEVSSLDKTTQYAGLGFDASVWEIFPYLIKGSSILLIDKSIKLEVDLLHKTFKKRGITISFLPTPICEQFIQNSEGNYLRCLLTGGDKLQTINSTYELFNNYGPTEGTVVSTSFKVEKNSKNIPIGKPISNAKVYILDPRNEKLVPKGVAAEMCLGGIGIAKGYLNNPELTSTNFIENPYLNNDIIYKTGDIVSWLDDGNIEFLGRKDEQVKIRGYRIELSEIEKRIREFVDIKDVAVSIKYNAHGDKYISAYYLSNLQIDEEVLKSQLLNELPTYMIPAFFTKLDVFPLTSNGKVDKKALPLPNLLKKDTYVPPRNDRDQMLINIYESTLGIEGVGIDDSFFRLGGDSIKSIQLISKINREGYQIKIKDIFEYPTIRDLSKILHNIKKTTNSKMVGKIPLTPIQEYFFSNHIIHKNHFNQSIVISKEGFLDEKMVTEMFFKIQNTHDSLKTVYKNVNGIIQPEILSGDLPLSLLKFDCVGCENTEEYIKEKSNIIQQGIDLGKGPMMKIGLFHLHKETRILIVIHHLAIDTVSWRILMEDMGMLYEQYMNKEKLEIISEETSYGLWAKKLKDYANSEEFSKQIDYWNSKPLIHPIKLDINNSEQSGVLDSRSISFSLSKETTHHLKTKVNNAFGTNINDILITGLCLGLNKTFKMQKIAIAMEGHGREDIFKELNLSRTTGWFTSLFPIFIDVEESNDLSDHIKNVKENLHKIPNKGIGYGILNFLTTPEKKDNNSTTVLPEIFFNYLGQFGEDISNLPFKVSYENMGDLLNYNEKRQFKLGFTGIIIKDRLEISATFSKKEFSDSVINNLIQNFNVSLNNIINFCLNKDDREYSPSDFTYKEISQNELDSLFDA